MDTDYNDFNDYRDSDLDWIMTLRSSDLQSDSDLDSIRNSCDVFLSRICLRHGLRVYCMQFLQMKMGSNMVWHFSDPPSAIFEATIFLTTTLGQLGWAPQNGKSVRNHQSYFLLGIPETFRSNSKIEYLVGHTSDESEFISKKCYSCWNYWIPKTL